MRSRPRVFRNESAASCCPELFENHLQVLPQKGLIFSQSWTVALISDFCHWLYSSYVCFMIRHALCKLQACATTTVAQETFSFAFNFHELLRPFFTNERNSIPGAYSSFSETVPAKGMKQRFLLWLLGHSVENWQPPAACSLAQSQPCDCTCFAGVCGKEELEVTQRYPPMPWRD